jgi:glutaredoxin
MEEIKVLTLDGCKHCKSLLSSLEATNIPFEVLDANQNSKLADRIEALLKIDQYPMVIMERPSGSQYSAIYFYREDSYEKAKATPIGYGMKVGCVSTDMMVDQIKKHLK